MVFLFCVVCLGFLLVLILVLLLFLKSDIFFLMCSFVCHWTCRLCIGDLGLFKSHYVPNLVNDRHVKVFETITEQEISAVQQVPDTTS